MRDAFGVERPDLVSKDLGHIVTAPGRLQRAAAGTDSKLTADDVMPTTRERRKIAGQWRRAESGSGQQGIGGPMLIGGSVEKAEHAGIIREPLRSQRRRDRRLRQIREST